MKVKDLISRLNEVDENAAVYLGRVDTDFVVQKCDGVVDSENGSWVILEAGDDVACRVED